tara:strand:+ start:1828 stop:2364 length:537 start_codon:yes stop_codon:yes gene_type:complete
MYRFVMMLTYSRIICGPLIYIISIFFEQFFFAFLIFVYASITDYFDGLLSRKYEVSSSLGALLDPIADKILLASSLITLIVYSGDIFIGLISMIILIREFWVSALREFASQLGKSSKIKVKFLAKVKTSAQFFSIGCFLLSFAYNNSLGIFISSFLLFLSMLITIKTALNYTIELFND